MKAIKIAQSLKGKIKPFFLGDSDSLVLRLTLLVYTGFVFEIPDRYSIPSQGVKVLFYFYCACGLAFDRLLRSPAYWFVPIGGLLYTMLVDFGYYRIPNHFFVIFYWLMAISIGLLLRKETGDYLVFNARNILCLVIGISVVQKVASPTFLDGSFFYERVVFEGFFKSFLELGQEYHQSAHLLINSHRLWAMEFPGVGHSLSIESVEGIRIFAKSLAWFTLLVEAVIVGLLAFPRFRYLRHFALLGLFLPIILLVKEYVFASMMLTMGLAICLRDFHKLRYAYVSLIAFALVLRFFPGLNIVPCF